MREKTVTITEFRMATSCTHTRDVKEPRRLCIVGADCTPGGGGCTRRVIGERGSNPSEGIRVTESGSYLRNRLLGSRRSEVAAELSAAHGALQRVSAQRRFVLDGHGIAVTALALFGPRDGAAFNRGV